MVLLCCTVCTAHRFCAPLIAQRLTVSHASHHCFSLLDHHLTAFNIFTVSIAHTCHTTPYGLAAYTTHRLHLLTPLPPTAPHFVAYYISYHRFQCLLYVNNSPLPRHALPFCHLHCLHKPLPPPVTLTTPHGLCCL